MPDFSSVYRRTHEPTPAQLDAGNYPKRRVAWHGLTVSIENEAGSVRRGKKPDGSAWQTRMVFPYGYVLGSLGVDGDHVDVFLGPNPDAPTVYVVHQRRVGDWERYDEDKCFLGFASQEDAVQAFLAHYDDPRFLGPVTALPFEEFRRKVLAANGRMVKSILESFSDGDNLKSQDVTSSLDFGQAMLKGNSNHDQETGRFAAVGGLPSSAGLATLQDAERYFRDHIAGVWSLTVNRKAGLFRVRVNFNENAPHAYTKENKATGLREFEPQRARLMQHIIGAIAAPDKVMQNGNRDLFVVRSVGDIYYAIVLEWKPDAKEYRFRSAHHWSKAEFDQKKKRYGAPPVRGAEVQKNEAPIRKSVGASNSTFPVCDPSRIGPLGPGGAPSEEGSCWPRDDVSIGHIANLVKAGSWDVCDDWLVKSAHRGAPHPRPTEIVVQSRSCGSDVTPVELGRAPLAPQLDFGQWMLKSEHGPIPAGAHWITVHPGGEGKGQPILVMPHEDGSLRVIGGAGGALNHLKLRGVKKGEDYKQSLKDRAQQRQAARKEQIAKDKAAGVHEQKTAEKGKIKDEMRRQRQEFVRTVAELSGWDPESLEFDESAHAGLSEEAHAKARREHEKDLYRRAREVVEVNRKRLLDDHDARAASGLGEVPLQTPDPDTLSVQDLDPMPEKAPSLGFAPQYGKRAEAQGLTPEGLTEAAAGLAEPVPPEAQAAKQAKAAEKQGLAAKIDQEVEAFKLANPDTVKPAPQVLDDAKKAAALLKAHKKLKLAEQMARQASLDLQAANVVESKAHILEVSDAEVEEAARKQMEQDVRTIGAVGLLSEIGKMGGEESLGGHVAAGAFNALNAVATAVGGEALIDRSVVDVLGINAAAQVLARRIANSYQAGELERIRQGVEDHHVNTQDERQRAAVDEAQKLAKAAADIELPAGTTGFDLAIAQDANHKRREAVNQAKRLLGQATGELQANAALVMALRDGVRKSIDVPLGKLDTKAAITRLHALGLKSGDYALEEAGGNLVASLSGDGLDRLAKPIDVDGLKQVRRNMDIISGKHDEDGWLPHGFADRPDLAMHVEPSVAQRLAEPFQPGADLRQAVRDYIGGRAADGDSPSDILADLQSSDFFQKAGDPDQYRAALDDVAPLMGEDGKMRPVESLADRFRGLADDFVESRHGGKIKPIHRQDFAVDDKSVDALHRALAKTPEGVAAFKSIGDLTPQERTGLRKFWESNVGAQDAHAGELRDKLSAHEKEEPEKSSTDMFGDETISPAWQAWKQQRDDLTEQIGSSGLDWRRYVSLMGSPEQAVEAAQDLVRSRVTKDFADAHNTLHPDAPLKLGRQVIRGNLNHLDAVDPAAREKRQAEHAAMVDAMRERVGGKYASGSVSGKIEAKQQEKAAFEQSQMGFFSADELGDKSADLAADERHTLGHVAEQRLAGMMSVVGQHFRPGQPTKLWRASMSDQYAPQQRAIKLLDANKRVMLGYGAGSGKTAIALGATTHLIEQGKIKRALHLVPSIVQDQYNGEALRYLEPGKYKWHCRPGASRAERIAAYKDPSHHFCVMTHEAFRSDMVHLGAKHAGLSEAEMTDRLGEMSPMERKDWAKAIMDKEGIDFGATFVDEAHQIVNRAGKENSARANVIDAVSDNTPYYVYASGDPVKNDPSELHDIMAKLDRQRHGDRDAFLRAYGGDTLAAKQSLKHELARYGISNTIAPPIKADYQHVTVPLSKQQHQSLGKLDKYAARLRLARAAGKVDVDAARALSPGAFDGVPDDRHEAVADGIQKSLGIVKESAVKRVINSAEHGNAKVDKTLDLVAKHKGEPGVVFAHNRAAVDQIVARLKAAGHRVTTITGADSAADKAKKRLAFNPESGEPTADILVASDAGAVGMNLQRGRWLIQHDIPDTAMVHGQRAARIHRLGQQNDVSVYTLAADHKSERRAVERLQKKYQLRELMLDPMDALDDTGVAGAINKRLAEQHQAAMF